MRYDNLRKTDRNKQLIRYYKDHPALSLKEIGRAFGISAVRVHQILKVDQNPKRERGL